MNGDVHVVPISDLKAHVEDRSCWCNPKVTKEPGAKKAVVSHNSMDGRELVERHGLQ